MWLVCKDDRVLSLLAQELEIPRGNFEKRKVPSVTLPNKAPLVAGFDNLSRHPYGCRIVQRILEKCTIEDYKHRLVKKVCSLLLCSCSCLSFLCSVLTHIFHAMLIRAGLKC